jgi:hypothetical protein
MSLRSVTLSRFGASQSLFLLFNTARKETSNTNRKGGRRDRVVVEFTTTCTIGTYYH